jgi:type I restriction enzyme S subunit
MTNEQFLQQFGHFIDAPNGIQKLREMVLQLAVQGKLVEQDTNDEVASDLLNRIKKHQKQLIKDKEVRKPKDLPEISIDEIPHSIPDSWKWVRLADIGQIVGGGTPKSSEPSYWSDNGVTWLTPADLYGYSGRYIEKGKRDISEKGLAESSAQLMPAGAVLFSSRAPIGYVAIASKPLATNQGFKSCVPYTEGLSECLYYFLKHAAKGIDAAASGTTFKEVSGAKVSVIPVPLPPLAEQHRIVAKVDELMALCDQLEAERNAREATHQRIIRAVHHPLTEASDAKVTPGIEQLAAWHRIRDNFADLYTTLESVQALRQTILQLAVQGKLVEQDISDEGSLFLLEKIKKAKTTAIVEKVYGKLKALPSEEIIDPAYQLPDTWRWSLLDDITYTVHYGYTASADHNKNDVRLLRITDIQNNRVDWESVPGCEITEKNYLGNALRDNDILIARTGGTIGKTYIVENLSVKAVFASYLIRAVPCEHMSPRYLKIFMETPLYWGQLYAKSAGTGQPNVNATSLRALQVPIPPLAEQHRIVKKVDELMSLCDKLEANIRDKNDTAARYAEAIVQQIAAA